MVRIQIIGGYLDLKEEVKLPLNFGVADIRDLSKRSGAFSKTVVLVGSDNNNALLNQYYDVNIQAGTFNIDKLTTCSVLENGIPILEDAYLQLISINKVQSDNGNDEQIEYSVLIKDAQADFFTKIDNAELTDLDFTDLNHEFNSINTVASHTHTVVDGYVYPIQANPSSTYPLSNMLPAIYTKLYWDRIHSTNGFSYEWADMTPHKFDLTVIPYNGEYAAGNDIESYAVEFYKNSFIPTLNTDITLFTEVLDDENLFDPTTGVYSSPFYISGSQAVNFEIDIDADINLINGTGADAYLVQAIPTTTYSKQYQAQIKVIKNGSILPAAYLNLGLFNFYGTDNPLANGTTILGTITNTLNFGISNILSSDVLTFQLEILETASGGAFWADSQFPNYTPVTITSQLDVTAMNVKAELSVNSLGFGQEVIMNNFVPKKIKQKDLIKWICFRWNLYIEQDKDNPKKLIYKSRDKYYDEGKEVDWTYKLAKDKKQELQFLPELTSKKVILSDKIDKDDYNQVYLDALNEVYGQVEFTYTNEYVKNTDTKTTIFSPTPMIRTPFNAVVPSINGSSPKNNIRLLMHNGVSTCDAYSIIDYDTSGQIGLTSYPVVSHFDNNNNPTFDLNFGVCDYYFYTDFVKTNNNMYNLFWRRTINQINTGKMLVGYFDLNESDIQSLELSDKIRVMNSWWTINRVVDYNANGNDLTKVELLSVDSEIELAPFKTNDVISIGDNLTNAPFEGLASKFYQSNNLNYSEGSTTIKGVNNIVNPNVKAFVIGDNGIIDSDGYWVDGVKVGELKTATSDFKGVTTDYTVNCEEDEIIEVITSGVVIVLPDKSMCIGKKIYIKNYSGGSIFLTTETSSIDGDKTRDLLDKESLTLTSDSNRWIIL